MYKRLSNGLVPRFKRDKAVVAFCRLSKDEHSPHSLIEMIHCSLQDEKGSNEILWFICEKWHTINWWKKDRFWKFCLECS